MDNEHNVELMRRHILNEEIGDSESVLAEMTDPPTYYLPGIGRYLEGREPIMALHNALPAGYEDDFKMEIREIAANDTFGFTTLEIYGTLKYETNGIPAGTYTVMPVCATYKFRDGKVALETIWAVPQRIGLTENLQGDPPVIRTADEALAMLQFVFSSPPAEAVPAPVSDNAPKVEAGTARG
jgi:SnoaL-like domain